MKHGKKVGRFQKLINERQVPTLKQSLSSSLNYHYSNYIKLEEVAEPFSTKDKEGIVKAAERMNANEHIKFELQAYVNQLKRLKHFINSFRNKGFISEPNQPELAQVWQDIMDKSGVVNLLANKWASHRSIDYPDKDDDDHLHLTVLLSLELGITMWDNGHLYVDIKNKEFNLFHYHEKAINFINWVFGEVEKGVEKSNLFP